MRQRMPLKTAAAHEELERLTADYLAAGKQIRRYTAKRRQQPAGHQPKRRLWNPKRA
jgi:hypothetical protein